MRGALRHAIRNSQIKSNVVPPRYHVRSGSDGGGAGDDDIAGVPLRVGPIPEAGAGAAVARRRRPVRLELGSGQVQGAVRGGEEVVLGRRPAQTLERTE